MNELIFKQGSIEDLDFIKPLWEKLNKSAAFCQM